MTHEPTDFKKKASPAKKVSVLGIISALAVALSFLENLIPPLPMLPPGAKAGFSNIATMTAALYMGVPGAISVSVIKSLFVLITRGGTAFLMSFFGGIFSAVAMSLMMKSKKFGIIGIGICGAVIHNTAQLAVSVVLTGTFLMIYYYPFLLIFSLAAGTITGILLKAVISPLNRIILSLY